MVSRTVRLLGGREFADQDVAVADFVAVVLKEDVALAVVAEVFPVLVFAVGYKSVEHLVVAVVFEHRDAVEPMLDMVGTRPRSCRRG